MGFLLYGSRRNGGFVESHATPSRGEVKQGFGESPEGPVKVGAGTQKHTPRHGIRELVFA
jgi:hypothetical protein